MLLCILENGCQKAREGLIGEVGFLLVLIIPENSIWRTRGSCGDRNGATGVSQERNRASPAAMCSRSFPKLFSRSRAKGNVLRKLSLNALKLLPMQPNFFI